MKTSVDVKALASRKWILLMTLVPAIITDIAAVCCNTLAWFLWNAYGDIDMYYHPEILRKALRLFPHVPILSLTAILLSAILIASIINVVLHKTNKIANRKPIKYFNIIIAVKAVMVCVLMYLLWYSQNLGALADSPNWTANCVGVGKTAFLLLPLAYIPIVVIICKNKDRV